MSILLSPLVEDTNALRQRRRALRAEMNRVQHWRRLLRARIDLSVAAALLPDRLGVEVRAVTPQAHIPDHLRMAQLIRHSMSPSSVLDITALRDLEREVVSYGTEVRSELERVTNCLVHRLTEELTEESAGF